MFWSYRVAPRNQSSKRSATPVVRRQLLSANDFQHRSVFRAAEDRISGVGESGNGNDPSEGRSDSAQSTRRPARLAQVGWSVLYTSEDAEEWTASHCCGCFEAGGGLAPGP